jgi:hypothetical protein
VSYVENAKRLTRASASGPVSDASTPVRVSSTRPATRRQRHGVSTVASAGACPLGQITETSSGVHVTETTPWPGSSPEGTGVPAGSRQIA